jgi:hypothetical protein
MLEEEILPVIYGIIRAAELDSEPDQWTEESICDRGMKRMDVANALELLECVSREDAVVPSNTVTCQQLARAGGLRTMCALLSSFAFELARTGHLMEREGSDARPMGGISWHLLLLVVKRFCTRSFVAKPATMKAILNR